MHESVRQRFVSSRKEEQDLPRRKYASSTNSFLENLKKEKVLVFLPTVTSQVLSKERISSPLDRGKVTYTRSIHKYTQLVMLTHYSSLRG